MMHIEETEEERDKLLKLCDDKDEKIKLLSKYILKIVQIIDSEAEYELEQNERKS